MEDNVPTDEKQMVECHLLGMAYILMWKQNKIPNIFGNREKSETFMTHYHEIRSTLMSQVTGDSIIGSTACAAQQQRKRLKLHITGP